ncbi:MAG: hypothetical protein ACFFDN_40735 [Candidatus Hodarchaeota archaeon]
MVKQTKSCNLLFRKKINFKKFRRDLQEKDLIKDNFEIFRINQRDSLVSKSSWLDFIQDEYTKTKLLQYKYTLVGIYGEILLENSEFDHTRIIELEKNIEKIKNYILNAYKDVEVVNEEHLGVVFERLKEHYAPVTLVENRLSNYLGKKIQVYKGTIKEIKKSDGYYENRERTVGLKLDVYDIILENVKAGPIINIKAGTNKNDIIRVRNFQLFGSIYKSDTDRFKIGDKITFKGILRKNKNYYYIRIKGRWGLTRVSNVKKDLLGAIFWDDTRAWGVFPIEKLEEILSHFKVKRTEKKYSVVSFKNNEHLSYINEKKEKYIFNKDFLLTDIEPEFYTTSKKEPFLFQTRKQGFFVLTPFLIN